MICASAASRERSLVVDGAAHAERPRAAGGARLDGGFSTTSGLVWNMNGATPAARGPVAVYGAEPGDSLLHCNPPFADAGPLICVNAGRRRRRAHSAASPAARIARMPPFTAHVIPPDQVRTVYPLVREAVPGLDLKSWVRFAAQSRSRAPARAAASSRSRAAAAPCRAACSSTAASSSFRPARPWWPSISSPSMCWTPGR